MQSCFSTTDVCTGHIVWIFVRYISCYGALRYVGYDTRTYTESWLTQFECITELTYRSQPIWREEDGFRCGRWAEQAGALMWEVQRKPHGYTEGTVGE